MIPQKRKYLAWIWLQVSCCDYLDLQVGYSVSVRSDPFAECHVTGMIINSILSGHITKERRYIMYLINSILDTNI